MGAGIPSRLRDLVPWIVVSLGGLCAALAFPLPGWSGLAWLATGILVSAGLGCSPGRAFRMGYVAGLVQFLVSLRWLLLIPFPTGAVAGWLALGAYCALYSGLGLWISAAVIRRASGTGIGPWMLSVSALTRLPWWHRAGLWFLLATVFTGLEWLRVRFLSGFPWNLFGVTQWQNAPLIQVASVTGVYGITFLLHWISLSLLGAALQVRVAGRDRFSWTAELRIPLAVLLILVAWGFRRITQREPAGPMVTLALMQPSIPQTLIWDDDANPERFRKVFELSQTALAGRPDALVWPEGSLPDITEEQFAAVTGQTRKAGAWWFFGTGYGQRVNGQLEHYNAALLVDPQGQVSDRYHKRRLVIFGEFIPFEKFLPFMKWLTPIGSSFTPGNRPAAFRFGPGTHGVASPVICFEDMFPETTRDHVTPETDFLLELTNDGWFGQSSAQWQHCAGAAMRAVENGVPLVRCANNGLTCWIDEYGVLRDLLGRGGDVYAPGVLATRVPGRNPETGRSLTWYHRHGDVFGWLCFTVLSGTALLVWRWERADRRSLPPRTGTLEPETVGT